MKKRILAFILSGCMLIQSPGFISWAASGEITNDEIEITEYNDKYSAKTFGLEGGEVTNSEAGALEDDAKTSSEADAPEDGEQTSLVSDMSEHGGETDSETDESETGEATDSETDESEDGEATDSETDASDGDQESENEEQISDEDELPDDETDLQEEPETDQEEAAVPETDQEDETVPEEEQNVTELQEEAIGEAAYMELETDENNTQKVQYAQSSVNSQAAGSGTIKASQGLYFGYTVENSAKHTGMLSEYLSESGSIVVPHKLGNYYMVGIGDGVFSGMNRTDPSNISKLPSKSSSGKTVLSSGEEKILELVNDARIKQGKIPLVMSSTLREAARRKTLDMFNNNYFDHKNPDGTYTYSWLTTCGYPWNMWAENIAYNYESAERLYDQWWNSPGHKANMMDERLRAIGIGVYKSSDGKIMGTQIFSSTIFQNLKKVEIEYGYETIGSEAFRGCTNLKSITIPSTVSKIASNAFEGCNSLTIYGKAGSYAQTFAEEKNIPFKAVEENCPIKSFRYEQPEIFMEKGDMDFIKLVIQPVDYEHLIKEGTKPEQQVVRFLEDGAVLALEEGNTEIRATAAELEAVCKITVGKKQVPLQAISFYEESIELYKGESIKPAYRITPVDTTDLETAILKSSDNNVFVVNENNTITAVNAGEAQLTASNEDGSISAVMLVKVLTMKDEKELAAFAESLDLRAVTNIGGTLESVVPGGDYGSLEGNFFWKDFSWKEPKTKLKAKAGEPIQYFSAQYTAKDEDGNTIRQDCILPVAVSTVSGLTATIGTISEMSVGGKGKELASGGKLSLQEEGYELRIGVKATGTEVDSSFYVTNVMSDNLEIAQAKKNENGSWTLEAKKAGKFNLTVEVRLKDNDGSYGPDKKPYGTYKKKYSLQIEDAVYVNELQIDLEPGMSTGVQKLEDGSFLVEDVATKFYVRARALDRSEKEIDTALTFGTDKSGVLQVRAVKGETGLAEVTVKKFGTAVITVTAKDNGKRTKSVTVQNLSPQLQNKTWTLNKWKPAVTAAINLQESEFNPIQSIALYEDKDLQNPSSLFSVQKESQKDTGADAKEDSEAASYTIGFRNQNVEQVTKGSYKLYLKVDTQAKNGYLYQVTVKLKNTKPSVKLQQSAKINLFYKDAESQLKITTGTEKLAAEGPQQINIAKDMPHFEVSWKKDGDVWTGTIIPVGVTADNYKKINKTIEVNFYFPEYGADFYITKKLTVKYNYKKAALTTNPAGGIIYQKTGDDEAVFNIVEKTGKNILTPGEGTDNIKVRLDDSMTTKAQLMSEPGNPNITIRLLGNKSITVKMAVSHSNWREASTCSFKMTVNKNTPSLVLEQTKVSLNTNAAGKEIFSLKASVNKNDAVSIVRLKDIDIVGNNAAAKKLLEEGKISICPQKNGDQRRLLICLNDSSVKNGTYKYKVYGWCKQGETKILRMNPVTLSITVTNKQPSASLKAKGKITLSNPENSGITYTPKISNATGGIRSAALGGSYASAFALTDCGDGTYQVKLKENAKIGKGSYKLYFAFTLENGTRVQSKEFTIKIG